MVVPMEGVRSSTSKSKKYLGNGLTIHLPENKSRVSVIGNECTITIDNNNGVLKVIGNACCIRVPSGSGEIVYNGNEGCILVGPSVDLAKVTYLGNEGKVLRETPDAKRTSKVEEVPLDKCKKGVRSLNIVNKSHKHFSVGNSVCSITIPSVLAVPHVTECVIKIRRSKNK